MRKWVHFTMIWMSTEVKKLSDMDVWEKLSGVELLEGVDVKKLMNASGELRNKSHQNLTGVTR